MGIRQDIEDIKYEWWERGAKETLQEIREDITGKPQWEREYEAVSGGTEEPSGAVGERMAKGWKTSLSPGGAQFEANIQMQRMAEKRLREAYEIQVAKANVEARRQAELRQKSFEEARQRQEDLRIKQEARSRGRTIQQVRTEKAEQRTEELQAIEKAREIKEGKPLTRRQYVKAIGGAKGLAALRRGTKREAKVFRRTGVSLEEERRKEREVQPIDSVRQMISVGASMEPSLTLEPTRKPTGVLESGLFEIQRQEGMIRTESLRSSDDLEFMRQAKGMALGLSFVAVGTALGIKQLITKPKETVKEVVKGIPRIPERLGRFGMTIEEAPGYATGIVAGEILAMKGTGIAVSKIGKGVTKVRTKISPKYRPVVVEKGIRVIKDIPSESAIRKSFDIKISKPVKQITEPLSKQVRLAGREADIISAQRSLFGKITRRKIKIEKPKLTTKALELERAFFADPRARLRISRLGIIDEGKQARILDILSGDVTLKKTKPQAIVFEKTRIAKFPRALKTIERKLKAGKPLTVSEQQKLVKWQLTPTGEFKPIGFLSREPEVTLAPGEIIKKVETPAVTLIEGRRVEIIRPKIITATKRTKQLLKKKKLTPKESMELTSRLSRETGFDVSRAITSKKYVSPITLEVSGISAISRAVSKISYSEPIALRRRISKPYKPKKRKVYQPFYEPYSYKAYPTYLIPKVSPRPRISPISKPQPVPRITTPIIKEPIPIPPRVIKVKRKQKKVKPLFRDDLLYVPGFTARALGIKKKLTRKQMLKKLEFGEIGIREVPILSEPIIK